MGRLYISEENEIKGPWLLGHANLETLNTLLTEIDIKLSEALVKTIENTAKQQMEEDNQNLDLSKRIAKLQRKYSTKLKLAQITFSDGNTYEANDIEGILNYVDTNPSMNPTELYIRTTHGNHENEFDLIINANAGYEEVDFEYRIKCIDEEIQQKIKTLIDKWIRENKPSRPLQLWSNYIIYGIWFIGGFAALISGNSLSYTYSKADSYKIELKKEAQRIIENKDSKINIDSAYLLLLKLESDYVPDNIKAQSITVQDKDNWKIFIVSSVMLMTSIIRPKTIIGIGKKYNRLQIYKFWIYIIYGTIVLLVSTIISDSFLHFINW